MKKLYITEDLLLSPHTMQGTDPLPSIFEVLGEMLAKQII